MNNRPNVDSALELSGKKVGLLIICVNQPYWQYVWRMVESARKYFLPNQKVDFLLWSDLPEDLNPGCKLFPIEPIGWPFPTLMRYNLFLQEEETLKKYDYLFYVDADMLFVDTVGDEILGEGLTMAEHPMYSLRREYVPPYEPNPDSTAYIPRLGVVVNENGKPWFKPLYAAGGFQGGKTEFFIEAMKTMKKNIDTDFVKNYIAIWNDESHWNKYLYGYRGHLTVLSPSYVYPDSLIDEYYVKIWGKKYPPKLVTLTKSFTTSKENGDDLKRRLASM